MAPGQDGVAQVMELHPPLVLAGPQVRQRLAELRVPHQRWQVVQHHGHPDVVDRRVGERTDDPVGPGRTPEQPHVTGAREGDGVVEGQHRRIVAHMKVWKWLGLAGLAGVAATGVVVTRQERQRRAYTPDEVRARLLERARG